MLVILDSSMLMLPLEKKINITNEIERILNFSFKFIVPEEVFIELEKLCTEATPSTQRKAKFALELATKFDRLPPSTEIKADDAIINLAEKHNAIVATNDGLLRKKLLAKGISVISLFGKNKLELFGEPKY